MQIRVYNLPVRILFFLLWLLPGSILQAQGFSKHYSLPNWSTDAAVQSVFPQADGSFRLTALVPLVPFNFGGSDITLYWLDIDAQGEVTGSDSVLILIDLTKENLFLLENGDYLRAVSNGNTVSLTHFDSNNSMVWNSDIGFPNAQLVKMMKIRANDAGEIFLRGAQSTPAVDSGFVMKFSPQGDLLWKTSYDRAGTTSATSLKPTSNGGCVLADFIDGPPNTYQQPLVRFAGDGTLQWSYYSPNGRIYPYSLDYELSVNTLGESLVPVSLSVPGSDSLSVEKVAANGQLLHRTNVSAILGLASPYMWSSLSFPANDGGWNLIAGQFFENKVYSYLVELDAVGNVARYKLFNVIASIVNYGFEIGQELPDGSLLMAGNAHDDIFLIKLVNQDAIYPHTLTGQVARDSTFDCLVTPNEPPLSGWVVTARKNGITHFAASNATGQYAFSDLDTGSYLVKILPKNYLWQACLDSTVVTFPDTLPQTDTLNFPFQPLYDCPAMQVDLGTNFLRRCYPSTYTVNYCNAGNQSADPVNITLTLDPLFQVDSASIPYTQAGSVLNFAIGAVAPGDCGNIRLYCTLSCDAELGQTLCNEAHIFPDTICASSSPTWSGAVIEVTAHCLGDSVQFSIHNTGSATTSSALDFIIVDDHVITRQGQFSLPANGSLLETVPADGSTWRLTADQEPGFPFGPQMPSIAVEGCNPTGGGSSTGMINLFSNYSGNPFNDIDCHTVIGSYDPNDKQAFPIGVDNQHFIEQNQPIDYQIRFQNTGTDTAFLVVIKDTLSHWLNPASIRPGASSHPYTWNLSGTGILTVTFDDILLPDSNINEMASHGFVQFHMDQQRDNPLGAVVTNRAGIYFDFNAPVMTNTVWHTIGQDFLPVATAEPTRAPLLRVWPNPASQTSTVWMDRPFEPGQQLVLRDAFGRIVQEMSAEGPSVQLRRNNLPAGLYFLELRNAKGILGLGKVVWE